LSEGEIAVASNRQSLEHRYGGTIVALNVREGARVAAGTVLIELAGTEVRAQLAALGSQLVEAEAAQARLVSAPNATPTEPVRWATLPPDERAEAQAVLVRQRGELDSQRTTDATQFSILAQRRQQMNSKIEGVKKQIDAIDRQAKLIDDEIAAMTTLAEKGLIPLPRLRAVQRTRAQLDGSRAELEGQIRQTEASVGEGTIQGLAVDAKRSEGRAAELRLTETSIAELLPKVAALSEQRRELQVRAPVAGTVFGLTKFTVGGVVQPGERLLDIVPDDRTLVIEARIKPEDADDLRAGMASEVRFRGIRSRAMPVIHGVVDRVSPDAFHDDKSGLSFFRARITVPPAEVQRVVAARPDDPPLLKAGLPAEVIVPLRKRTALEYLFEPLSQSFRRSFIED
jgi:HlyD family secretion protein